MLLGTASYYCDRAKASAKKSILLNKYNRIHFIIIIIIIKAMSTQMDFWSYTQMFEKEFWYISPNK